MKTLTLGVDVQVDKKSLNDLNRELVNIANEAKLMAKSSQGVTEEFKRAGEAAEKISTALDASYNSKLNQINLNKFNTELKKSGNSAEQLMKDLAQGPASAQIAFNNLTRSLITTNVHLRTTSQILDKFAVTFKNTVRYGISSSIFNNLSNSISKAYDYSVKLDKSLNDIRIVSNKSAEDMERFAVSANKAAKELGRSTLDYTKASTIFFQQGLDDIDVEARTQATLKAANVTGQTGEAVSEQLTAVWNGYKVSAAETELYVDKLAAVAATSASNLEELSTGMSKVAAAANIMGVDIDQLNAQLSTVISVTRQAPESVGTAFKTIYARMGDIKAGLDDETTLGNYTSQMAELGFNVLDVNGELRDMGAVIEEIGGKWNTLSREQQIALTQIMAGRRQYNNLLSLFDNWDKYTQELKISQNAFGTLQKQQDIYMETTKAHLQQLTTEAERTYAILFDKKTVDGFYDSTQGLLDELNDWLEGLGGGFNAIINLASQLGIIFRKQIADSLVRNINNIKDWIFENKINLGLISDTAKAYEKINKQVKDERAKNSVEAKNLPAYLQVTTQVKGQEENLYLKQQNENTDELIKKNKELLKVKNYISDETFNEVQNNLKDVAAIEDKLAEYKTAEQYIKEQGLTSDFDIEGKIEGSEIGLKRTKEAYDDIHESLTDINHKMQTNKDYLKENQEELMQIQESYEEILLFAQDEGFITKEEAQKKLELVDVARGQINQEEVLNTSRELRNKLEAKYQSMIKAGKMTLDDNGEKEKLEKQKQDIEKKIDDEIKKGQQNKTATRYTAAFMGMTQAATATLGAIKTLNSEISTSEEKLNAAYSGITGSLAGIANMIAPGSGFLIQGLAEVGKLTLETLGIWDNWVESMKSTSEKLQDIEKEIQNIKDAARDAQNTLNTLSDEYESGNKALKEFQQIQDRFEYLQELANKGLLTPELRSEYESYLKKVQEYNKEAIISYNTQGEMITANNNLMKETIEQLKKLNEENLGKLYSNEAWQQGVTVAKAGYTDIRRYNKTKKLVEERADNQGYSVRAKRGEVNQTSEEAELVRKINNLENYLNNEQQLLEDLDKIEEKFGSNNYIFARANHAISDNYAAQLPGGRKANFEEYKEATLELFEAYQEAYNKYQTTKGKEVKLDNSFLYNHLIYNTEKNEEYKSLVEQMGETDAQTFLQTYIQSLSSHLDDFTDKNGFIDYNEIAEHLQQIQKNLAEVFEENLDLRAAVLSSVKKIHEKDYATSEEYEKAIQEEIENISKLITSEEQFNKLVPALASLYNLDSVAGLQWDSEFQRATFGKNGMNLVTKGEVTARSIGQNFGATQADKDFIEQYLQSVLSEEELANIDVSSFNQKLNQKLYGEALAIDPEFAEYVRYKELLAKRLKTALTEDEKTLLATIEKNILILEILIHEYKI